MSDADLRLEFDNASLQCVSSFLIVFVLRRYGLLAIVCRIIRRAPLRLLPHHHRPHRLVRPRVHDCAGDLCGVGCVTRRTRAVGGAKVFAERM